MQTHLESEATTLAMCWKITRVDGEEFCFTNHDTDIDYLGDTYQAPLGMLPTALEQSEQLNVDNMEAVTFFETGHIIPEDIEAGLFDFSMMDVFLINYEDVSMGTIILAEGWKLGQVEIRDNAFTAEMRSKSQYLQQNVCEMYSACCRAQLGDTRCGIDIADSAGTYWIESTVESVVDSKKKFIDTSTIESDSDDIFRFGKLTWLDAPSGATSAHANAGYEMEIKSWNAVTGLFTLFLPMPFAIEAGDSYHLTWGCDKKLETCRDRYDNIVNFRGEPFVPGMDKMMVNKKTGSELTREGLRPGRNKIEG